jgi:2-(1,2-epoxy-1,2-dihydrophenyl)acetyl-CoA isomerase
VGVVAVSSPYDTIIYEKQEGVAIIRMNRPEKLNALSQQMLEELATALSSAESDPEVRCVVITGVGRAFSAGADLSELQARYEKQEPVNLGQHLRRYFNPLILRIRRMEKPVIALVNGVAAGAGLGLALACDLRIASEDARFVEAFTKVGLIPDSGCTYFLPRLLGLDKAMELVLTGDGIDAAEAHRLGLVSRVLPRQEFEAQGLQFAKQVARGPTRSIGYAKRAINRALTSSLEDALEYEAYMQELAGRTSDHLEGVRAFTEKRQPQFTGR